MQTYCYSPLYDQMFSASDYLAVAEAGTDIWLTSKNATNTQQLFYYEGLTTSTNATNKLFKQAYSIINTCNAIINRAGNVADGNADDVATNQIGSQRARRDGGKQVIEPGAQYPAQHRSHSAHAACEEIAFPSKAFLRKGRCFTFSQFLRV
jgi:hypothetical protein